MKFPAWRSDSHSILDEERWDLPIVPRLVYCVNRKRRKKGRKKKLEEKDKIKSLEADLGYVVVNVISEEEGEREELDFDQFGSSLSSEEEEEEGTEEEEDLRLTLSHPQEEGGGGESEKKTRKRKKIVGWGEVLEDVAVGPGSVNTFLITFLDNWVDFVEHCLKEEPIREKDGLSHLLLEEKRLFFLCLEFFCPFFFAFFARTPFF